MKIKTAIKKLQKMLATSPNADVEVKRTKKPPAKKLTETLAAWARKRSVDGGTFSFLEACRFYDKIGGSAGTSTVRHRLENIGARCVSPDLAESHLRARWSLERGMTTGPIKEMLEADPTFKERYQKERRSLIERGRLAPPPFEQAVFEKDWSSKRGRVWVRVKTDDRDREVRLEVKPRVDYVPNHN